MGGSDVNIFDLDDETIAAIKEAESQADRGEGEELDAFRARMNQRMGRARVDCDQPRSGERR